MGENMACGLKVLWTLSGDAESCVNTSVFARCCPQNTDTVHIVVFAPKVRNIVYTTVLGFLNAKDISIYGGFCPEPLES